MKKKRKPDDWLVCNCAGCYRELVSASMRAELNDPGIRYVAGRMYDRPYCSDCLRVRTNEPIDSARHEHGGVVLAALAAHVDAVMQTRRSHERELRDNPNRREIGRILGIGRKP